MVSIFQIVSVSLSVAGLFVCTTKVNTLQRSDIDVNATKGKKCPKTVKIVDRGLAVISNNLDHNDSVSHFQVKIKMLQSVR